MDIYKDIRDIHGYDLEPVDIICGGSPCQDLSVAGMRTGLDGERSGLFLEQIRVIKEMREHDRAAGRTDEYIRPRWCIWENVPGAFSSGKPRGADFAKVLEEFAKIADPDFPGVEIPKDGWPKYGCLYDDCGRWSIAWRVHNAKWWGVPQRRKRIALVADYGGLEAFRVLFDPQFRRNAEGESGNEAVGHP